MKYLSNVTSLNFLPENCTGCGKCIEVCPRGVFRKNEKKVYITDRDKCMECGACFNNCEFDALTIGTGVGCASALIKSMISGGEPSCGCSESESTGCC